MKPERDRAYLAQVEECLAALEMAILSDNRPRAMGIRLLRFVVLYLLR